MNREIKFRLHDKEGKIIGYETHRLNEYNTWQIYQLSLRGDFIHDEERLVREGYFIAATYKARYTGLKDKNGVEIFEGDIIKSPLGNFVEVFFGKTVYKFIEAGQKYEIDVSGWMVKNKSGNVQALDSSFCEGEIVGSIFTNPELITC